MKELSALYNVGVEFCTMYKVRVAPCAGWLHAQRFTSKALSHLVYNTQSPAARDSNLLLLLQQCPHLNVSVCEISVTSSQKDSDFIIVAYNPLAWPRTSPVRVPIDADDSIIWQVTGDTLRLHAWMFADGRESVIVGSSVSLTYS